MRPARDPYEHRIASASRRGGAWLARIIAACVIGFYSAAALPHVHEPAAHGHGDHHCHCVEEPDCSTSGPTAFAAPNASTAVYDAGRTPPHALPGGRQALASAAYYLLYFPTRAPPVTSAR